MMDDEDFLEEIIHVQDNGQVVPEEISVKSTNNAIFTDNYNRIFCPLQQQ